MDITLEKPILIKKLIEFQKNIQEGHHFWFRQFKSGDQEIVIDEKGLTGKVENNTNGNDLVVVLTK